MKQTNVAFLFIFTIFSIIIYSCKDSSKLNFKKQASRDSLNIFIEGMKNNSFKIKSRIDYANKALKLVDEIEIDKIHSYQSYLYGQNNDYDGSIKILKILINKALKIDDHMSVANFNFRTGYDFLMKTQKDSALVYFVKAKNFYEKNYDSIETGRSLAQIAMIQSDFGFYIESDKNAIEAIKYINGKDEFYLSSIYNCLAISSKKQEDFKDAIYWYNKALELPSNDLSKIRYLNNKANSFRYLKDYSNSIQILEKLLLDSIVLRKSTLKARVLDNLAYTRWLSNANETVLNELLQALNIRQQENDLDGLNASFEHLSNYYKKENPDKALIYASKMYQLAKSRHSPQDQLEALQKLIALENSVKAKEYYNAYVRINDSLQLAKQQAKNRYVKIKYDSEKNRVENLKYKLEASEKELTLEKERRIRTIGIILSSSVILGLIGLAYYRKQRHRQEKRIEVYKTETRIAKKLHDEVANDMVSIMNKIQYTDNTPNQILDDLEKVYNSTRDISHENKTVETGENFEFYLKTMLSSFNTNETTIIIKDIHKVELIKLVKEKQIEIARTLQELMINMQKHSEASLVAISFKKDKNNYLITYSDNGIGLNMNKLILKNGLKNVETRIKSINGIINFESELNNGFKVFISFKSNSYV